MPAKKKQLYSAAPQHAVRAKIPKNVGFASARQARPRLAKKTASRVRSTIRSANPIFHLGEAHGSFNPERDWEGPRLPDLDWSGVLALPDASSLPVLGGTESYVGATPYSGLSDLGTTYFGPGLIDPAYDANQPGSTFDVHSRLQYKNTGGRESDIARVMKQIGREGRRSDTATRRAAERVTERERLRGVSMRNFTLNPNKSFALPMDTSVGDEIPFSVFREQSYPGHAGSDIGISNQLFGANRGPFLYNPGVPDFAPTDLLYPHNSQPSLGGVSEQAGGAYRRPPIAANKPAALGPQRTSSAVVDNLEHASPAPHMFATAEFPAAQGEVFLDRQNNQNLAQERVMQPDSEPIRFPRKYRSFEKEELVDYVAHAAAKEKRGTIAGRNHKKSITKHSQSEPIKFPRKQRNFTAEELDDYVGYIVAQERLPWPNGPPARTTVGPSRLGGPSVGHIHDEGEPAQLSGQKRKNKRTRRGEDQKRSRHEEAVGKRVPLRRAVGSVAKKRKTS